MPNTYLFKILFCVLLSFFAAFSSYAADEDRDFRPATGDASVVEVQIQEEVKRLPLSVPDRKTPEVEEAEKPEEPFAISSNLRFFVESFIFEGNQIFSSEELKKIAEPFENQEQTMVEVQKLIQLITAEYRARGYITSQAYIPVQKIEKRGSIRIAIIEGKVGDVLIEGNRRSRESLLRAYSVMQEGEIFQYNDLGQTVSRLNRNPDRTVKAVLKKSTKPDSSDVYLKVEERRPWHVGYFMDNQGSDTTGERRFGFTARHSNLLGWDDALSGGTVFGKDFGSVFSNYLFPIPRWDTKVSAGFSHTQLSPKRELKPFGINSLSQSYTTKIERRFYESQRMTLDMSAGFDFKESRTRLLSAPFRRERLRVLRMGPSMTFMDKWGTTQMSHMANVGLELFGARVYASPTSNSRDTDPSFFRYTGNLTRVQKMPFNTKLIAKMDVQVAGNTLPSSESMYLGGATSVRGYPEGDFLADTGYLLNFDYLVPFFFLPEEWHLPWSQKPMKQDFEFVTFLDQGYGTIRDSSGNQNHDRNLVGTGGGVRVRLYDHIFGRAEFAYALGQVPATDPENRFQVNLKVQAEI